MPIFFVGKNVRNFCSTKISLIFSIKNISVCGYEVVKHLTSQLLNELVKLTCFEQLGPNVFTNTNNLQFPVCIHRKQKPSKDWSTLIGKNLLQKEQILFFKFLEQIFSCKC